MISSINGINFLFDCLKLEIIIFLALSYFIFFRMVLSQIIGVILDTPSSVDFSKNHSNLSFFLVGEIAT